MTGKKIKVALCISGDPRNDIYAFPYIYKYFLSDPLLETDVYIHTWKNFESLDLYKPKQCLIENNLESKIVNNFLNKFKNLEKINLLEKYNFDNCILLFYSIYKCFNLIKENYDIYIRIRFDTYLNVSLNYAPIFNDLMFNKYDIFIPKVETENRHWATLGINKGYNDRFAISNYKGMLAYSNTFLNMEEIINQTNTYFSHWFLYHSLSKKDITVNNFPFYDNLIRKVNLESEFYNNFSGYKLNINEQ